MRDIYLYNNNFQKYENTRSKRIISGNIDRPLISVFIPTYKRAMTIKDTIESALNQKGVDEYEIVVINNNPESDTDETRTIIEKYNDKRLYYYVNEENIGLCGNWNRGLELCRAEYVAMIHDDDVLSPWFVVSLLGAIKKLDNPLIIGVSSTRFTSKSMPIFSKPERLRARKVTKRRFFFGRGITIAGMTVNRIRAIEVGGYSEDYYPNEDTVFIYQSLTRGRVVNIENILSGYRHEGNLSFSEGILEKEIIHIENMRRCIAVHERFARRWMKLFDKEYLYRYMRGAFDYWGINVDSKKIIREFGFSETMPNKIKMRIMGWLLRILSRI